MQVEQHFENLFKALSNPIYNVALHYLQNPLDAQDATQEVFIKIYSNQQKFVQNSASIKTWAIQITINHCLDVLRSRKTKKRMGFLVSLFNKAENEPLDGLTEINHPGILLEHKETTSKIFSIINTLPEKQKTVLILAKIESMPQQEIAQVMGISIKAVESLLQRAKQNVEKKLI